MSPAAPLISIGIPTYNRAGSYLKSALESALAQTYPNLQILVSDNCSSDDTEKLVRSYSSDTRLHYHRHDDNIGANANFNFCLDSAIGEYFLLLHDDDLIDPDFIDCCVVKIQQANLASGQLGLIRTGTRIIDGAGRELYSSSNNSSSDDFATFWRDWFAGRTSYYLCSTLFHTRSLRQLGGFGSPHNLLLDLVAAVSISAQSQWADVAEVKAAFRMHDGEITAAAKISDWCEDSLDLIERFERAVGDSPSFMREAHQFISSMAYRRCYALTPLTTRLRAMREVHQMLRPEQSPGAYVAERLRDGFRSKIGI